jgi:hypothetical protein
MRPRSRAIAMAVILGTTASVSSEACSGASHSRDNRATTSSPVKTETITGHVVNRVTGAGIAGAIVDLYALGVKSPHAAPDDASHFRGMAWVSRAVTDRNGDANWDVQPAHSRYCAIVREFPSGYVSPLPLDTPVCTTGIEKSLVLDLIPAHQ